MGKNKFTRILALCLVIVCLLSTVAALSYDKNNDGKTNVWDLQMAVTAGETDSYAEAMKEALGGAADELRPNAEGEYEIYSALGLYNMANIIDEGKDSEKTFKLMNDIDMKGAVWYATESFTGTFEGNGHVICNVNVYGEIALNANKTAYGQGFFGKIGREGAVRNLKLENVTVTLTQESKASYVGLLTGSVVGEIENCTTVGTVIDPRTSLTSTCYIGTLCGRVENTPDNPVVGIKPIDESILMTAESAQVTAISGKSQKVLCKMGMEFGQLSYPEGTESNKQYKRQLGIAGWAPDYTNFKAYNWQDISGATVVEGGTGKIYNLEDPILTARRQAAVDKMYEICTVQWTPSRDMTIYYYKTGTGENAGKLAYSTKTWKAGTTYYGMPYNHGAGSLERFKAYMDTKNGLLTVKETVPATSYYYTYEDIRNAMSAYTDTTLQTPLTISVAGKTYDLLPGFQLEDQPMQVGEAVDSADHAGFSRYIGNDCSQAIAWAWREVVSSDVKNGGTVISGVTQMCPTPTQVTRYGVTVVGDIAPEKFNVATIDALYNKATFMNAYAQASRGDALICDQTAGAHSRMIAYDPICIYTFNATSKTYVIDSQNSYLITHEQGGSSKNSYTTCNWDRVMTFESLLDDSDHKNKNADGKGVNCTHYFPTSINAFHDVDSKAVTSTVTYSKGVVKSNFYILSTTVDGVETFNSIGQHTTANKTTRVGSGYRDAHVETNLTERYGDLSGKIVTIRLSNGDIYILNGDTGAVTKQ